MILNLFPVVAVGGSKQTSMRCFPGEGAEIPVMERRRLQEGKGRLFPGLKRGSSLLLADLSSQVGMHELGNAGQVSNGDELIRGVDFSHSGGKVNGFYTFLIEVVGVTATASRLGLRLNSVGDESRFYTLNQWVIVFNTVSVVSAGRNDIDFCAVLFRCCFKSADHVSYLARQLVGIGRARFCFNEQLRHNDVGGLTAFDYTDVGSSFFVNTDSFI